MNDWTEYLKFLVALVSIANPIGAIPMFISLTSDDTLSQRRKISMQTTLAFSGILLVILFIGQPLLTFFGITVDSFRTAGGIIILLMAISMVHGQISRAKQTAGEAKDAATMDSIAIVPLSIPLLAGPGAISTVIVYSHSATSLFSKLIFSAEILIAALSVWLCLNAAPYIARFLGKTGMNIITRIMGLILAAIGIELITGGLLNLLPGLAQ
jgi:multiple antibiotic resistance protein